MKRNNKQKGFTIIELVVVILLLGILTATALPRFMDVEDQAHGAVVNAVRAGMITSAGLFRAQWYAEGQPLMPDAVTNYDNMYAFTSGYPIGIDSTNDIDTGSLFMTDSDACLDIYDSFLQEAGRPTIETIAEAAGSVSSTDVADAETSADFLAYLDTTNAASKRQCVFIYTGQFNDPALGDVPTLIYNAVTGNVTSGTTL